MENDIKEIKRKNENKIQIGRGYERLYDIAKNCDDEILQKFMKGLSEDDMYRICNCICFYLNGKIHIEDENLRKVVDEDEHLRKDMVDVASRTYLFEKKKNFLSKNNGCRGKNVAKLACHVLLPKYIEFLYKCREDNNKQILRLNRKIEKLRNGVIKEEHDEKEENDLSQERVDDRKKVLLEDERTDSVKRKSENDGGKRKKSQNLFFLFLVEIDL